MLLEIIDQFAERSKNLKVAVIGETITDEFHYVSYEGQSMKSICPAFRLTGKKIIQAGGAAAIANHLESFVESVELISNLPEEIIKTRYIDEADEKKHVEINAFNLQNGPLDVDVNDYDVVIVADFGHGFCDSLNINDGFHLMCQTNSNNFGFNRVSKWRSHKKASVCIDLREASLQLNKKINFQNQEEIDQLYNYELNTEKLFITLGSKGSFFYDGKNMQTHHSYKSNIVDTIGAGDTYFAFSCIASHVLDSDFMIIPSLAASLSTTWLCNEQSVNIQNLRTHAAQFI